MKRLMTMALVLAALAGCADKKKENVEYNSQGAADMEQAEVMDDVEPEGEVSVNYADPISDAVQRIYDDVAESYNTDGIQNTKDYFHLYCTEAFNELMRKTAKLANATEDIGPIDCDLWIMAQDYGKDLSMKVAEVKMLTDAKAIASIKITNMEQVRYSRVIVMKEHGGWKIDDFQMEYDGKWHSTRKNMEDYLK